MTASGEDSKLDIVVFGVTGVTGQFTVEKLLKLRKEIHNLKWGAAGRSLTKLNAIISNLSKKTGEDLSTIPIIIADINDNESLKKMAAQCCVVINCVGPYILYGEAVVKACIDMGTHCVDVSGEPQFMEKMQLEYSDLAKKMKVYVVSACGADSIPADLGTVFLTSNFEGDVNSVEGYVRFTMKSYKWGPSVNYGTLHSFVQLSSELQLLNKIRKKLFQDQLPQFTPVLENKWFVHRNEDIGGWSIPFPGPDQSVVQRSQRYFYQHESQRPVQWNQYLTFPWLVIALCAWVFMCVILLLIKIPFTKNFILKHPRLVTGGLVGVQDISEELAENIGFSLFLCGEGWKNKLTEPSDQHSEAPNKKMIVKVSGNNPVYGAACVSLVWSAITILQEPDKMPSSGGVYSPGAAFGKTSLIENLKKHGINFEIVAKCET